MNWQALSPLRKPASMAQQGNSTAEPRWHGLPGTGTTNLPIGLFHEPLRRVAFPGGWARASLWCGHRLGPLDGVNHDLGRDLRLLLRSFLQRFLPGRQAPAGRLQSLGEQLLL